MEVKVNPRGTKFPVAKEYKFRWVSLHMVWLKFPVEAGKLSRDSTKLSRPFLASRAIRASPELSDAFEYDRRMFARLSTAASQVLQQWVDPMFHGIPLRLTNPASNLLIIETISLSIELEKTVHPFALENSWK